MTGVALVIAGMFLGIGGTFAYMLYFVNGYILPFETLVECFTK
jgi:hypothetical protein